MLRMLRWLCVSIVFRRVSPPPAAPWGGQPVARWERCTPECFQPESDSHSCGWKQSGPGTSSPPCPSGHPGGSRDRWRGTKREMERKDSKGEGGSQGRDMSGQQFAKGCRSTHPAQQRDKQLLLRSKVSEARQFNKCIEAK